jgi:hypothetical protein
MRFISPNIVLEKDEIHNLVGGFVGNWGELGERFFVGGCLAIRVAWIVHELAWTTSVLLERAGSETAREIAGNSHGILV